MTTPRPVRAGDGTVGRMAAPAAPGSRLRTLVPVVAGGIALIAYVRTMLPGLAFGDWGEMQTVPHVLGVAHPTGYPTYVLLAWAAQLVPVGTVAARANLLSAVLVAGSVAVASLILMRLGVRPGLAVIGSVAIGATGTVWSAATVAEVNPLHLLLVALLIHRALIWEARRRRSDVLVGGLLLGLALGNHLLILFVAPFIVAFVAWVGRDVIVSRLGQVLAGAGAVVLGLSVYLTVPLAAALGPPLAYNHPVTLDAFWALVSGAQFRSQFLFLAPSGFSTLLTAVPALWSTVVSRGSVALGLLGVVGLALLVWRRPSFGSMAVVVVITNAYVWANYLRLEHYLLVSWLILGIGATYAVEIVARLLGRIPAVRVQSVAVRGLTALSAVSVVALGVSNWTASDRSREVGGDAFVESMLSGLPPRAAILTPWDGSTPLWHARYVLGQRPDILVVDDTNIVYDGWGTREERIAALICVRPVFILRLHDSDLVATRAAYRLEAAFAVRVGIGGPTAAASRTVMRVLPRDAATCSANR